MRHYHPFIHFHYQPTYHTQPIISALSLYHHHQPTQYFFVSSSFSFFHPYQSHLIIFSLKIHRTRVITLHHLFCSVQFSFKRKQPFFSLLCHQSIETKKGISSIPSSLVHTHLVEYHYYFHRACRLVHLFTTTSSFCGRQTCIHTRISS